MASGRRPRGLALRDEGLQRLPDADILTKAEREGRVLLTMDLDFGALLATSRGRFPSVVLFRLEDETPPSVNQRLKEVLDNFSQALEAGAIISVGNDTIRVRQLPIR